MSSSANPNLSLAAPHRSSIQRVDPARIDFNGHLNMAYYNVLFDRAADEIFALFGFGPDYRAATNHTTFSAEFHVCYLRELHVDAPVYVTTQLLDFDSKRFHFYQELYHQDGWLSATGEGLGLHINLDGPKVAPMPQSAQDVLAQVHKAHRALPRPDRVGRQMGIPK